MTSAKRSSLRILWLATKVPWPAVDGGRLVVDLSIAALVARGHHVTLVAPGEETDAVPDALEQGVRLETVGARLRPKWQDAVVTLAPVGSQPWTVRRHALRAIRRRAAALIAEARDNDRAYDIVHVEQVQALAGINDMEPLPPVVLRAQNVESDLWRAMAERPPLAFKHLGRRWMLREAAKLAAYEAQAIREASATVALTAFDARRLEELAGVSLKRPVDVVPAPFPSSLGSPSESSDRSVSDPSASDDSAPRLLGDPAIVLFGSAGWWPNRDGAEWFLENVWPTVARDMPTACLHAFGLGQLSADLAASERVIAHQAPGSAAHASAVAFAPGSILAVPLFVASGVRMKILEAWARRVPVVATPAAARGLIYDEGCELLVRADAKGFAEAFAQLRHSAAGQRMSDAGQRRLTRSYSPLKVAEKLEAIYRRVQASPC